MIDPNIPVPLILESLDANQAWAIISERLRDRIDSLTKSIVGLPPDTDARAIQRIVGQIEGLHLCLNQPRLLRDEWTRANKATTTGPRATR